MKAQTIAVLPFINISPENEHEYFSDGITEEIINALASIEALKVTSRTSSFYFKGKNIPLKKVAEELGVRNILEGSVRKAGELVRITAQLIDAREDTHYWSQHWDRKMENIFEIQDEISLLIAEKLREQFGHFEIQDHLVDRQSENVSVYELAMKARYHFNKWNPNDIEIAIQLYEKAIALEPLHVDSLIGLADAYSFLGTTEFIPREEGWNKAHTYIQKALGINPQHPGAYYQLANYVFFTRMDFKEAMEVGLKAIALKKNYPEAHQFVAFLYSISGQYDQAEKHLQSALSLNPLSQETLFFHAYFLYRKGAYQQSLKQLDSCLEENPLNIPAYVQKSYILLKLGQYDLALDLLDQLPESIVVKGDKLGLSCLAYQMKEDEEKAAELFTQLYKEAQSPTAFQAHSYLYLYYVNTGALDKAFQWLDHIISIKSSVVLLSFAGPLASKAQSDPRFPHYHRLLYPPYELKEQAGTTSSSPLLTDEVAAQYKAKLIAYMEEEFPFLNPQLSLRALAEQLEIHPNQLSWLLNSTIGKNFNEFINHYRIAWFKSLILDPANSHISIIGLAYESGFNSKSVFNTYFKKETGLTPKQFLKQHQ